MRFLVLYSSIAHMLAAKVVDAPDCESTPAIPIDQQAFAHACRIDDLGAAGILAIVGLDRDPGEVYNLAGIGAPDMNALTLALDSDLAEEVTLARSAIPLTSSVFRSPL